MTISSNLGASDAWYLGGPDEDGTSAYRDHHEHVD
jgi:hypothetical protein